MASERWMSKEFGSMTMELYLERAERLGVCVVFLCCIGHLRSYTSTLESGGMVGSQTITRYAGDRCA